MPIPAGTVLLVAAGGVLAYAGFTGQSPLAAIKDVTSGTPSGIANTGSDFLKSIVQGTLSGSVTGGGISALPNALTAFANDKYSQPKRWQQGYSDCSSFFGKGLKSLGIKPPGNSTTASYLTSSQWKRISPSNAQPGDAIVSTTHMVCYVGVGAGPHGVPIPQAIGQQNPRRNVQTGSVADLMFGTGAYVYLRYTPAVGQSAGGTARQATSNV